jgi:hypothetical protein
VSSAWASLVCAGLAGGDAVRDLWSPDEAAGVPRMMRALAAAFLVLGLGSAVVTFVLVAYMAWIDQVCRRSDG